ncbi:MAG: enoyl-CoA hydratase/isomerase family protein [Proteobacteria bacterium]|nr:enoyl-CoA hydratase/isomerase family protein [Pseudomonadota bacterium]
MSLEQAIDRLEALVEKVPASGGHIHLHVEGRLARILIDHPQARNALTAGMMLELARAVKRLSESDVIAIVLHSAEGGAFCAGGHLREVQKALGTPANGHQMALAMGAVLDALANLPAISLAAIEGPAIGGGAEIALTADYRVLGSDAAIHFVHTRLAVVPGWGGAGRLVDRLGRHHALDVLLGARSMPAKECLELGLADAVVPAGGAFEEATARAERILRRGAAARAAKTAVLARGVRSREQQAAEAAAFGSVWGSGAHRAALARVLGRLK